MQLAYFAGGCFWCLEAIFQRIEGVFSVIPGYCNGSTISPTYQDVCTGQTGHAEVIKIEFEEDKVSYEELLQVFFKTHDASTLNRQGNDTGTQYRSAVFYINDWQKSQASAMIKHLGDRIVTELTELDVFYQAEDYHTNYFNNNSGQPYCQMVILPKLDKHFKNI
jgi:peptide-methionine (S)-S-oxide reductase